MTRARRGATFAVIALALLGALAWVSSNALALEKDRNELRAYWAQQDALRLALWQMDASMAALLAGEAARPYYHYDALYEERYALVADSSPSGVEGELVQAPPVRVPSPLLQARQELLQPFFQLHFQLSPDGTLSSPQAPQGEARRRILAQGWNGEDELARYDERLRALGQAVAYRPLMRALQEQESERSESLLASPAPGERVAWQRERQRTIEQFAMRSQSAVLANGRSLTVNLNRGIGAEAEVVSQSGFVPLPFNLPSSRRNELAFVRKVRIGSEVWLQGLWANWRELRQFLLERTAAVYPEGAIDLVPLSELPSLRREGVVAGLLASVPVLITLRRDEPLAGPGLTETRKTLLVAWSVALAGLCALGLSLRAAHELSERRGRFVSTVTHELRTPLTTFCLYSEMLAQGVVTEPAARQEYYETLQAESNRLRRIVENVLAFARVEGGRGAPSLEELPLAELWERSRAELELRAAEAGLALELEDEQDLGGELVRAVPQSVAQILFNLVDNAAKYASEGERVVVALVRGARQAELGLRITDHGPGIPEAAQRVIFAPFERAEAAQDNDKPGIGLGLPLCRALAQQMGARLELEQSSSAGSSFVLTLSAR